MPASRSSAQELELKPNQRPSWGWALRESFLTGQRRFSLAQALDKSGDLAWRRIRCGPFNQLHDGAADDRGIRELRHLGDVLRIGDTEPHNHRQLTPSTDPVDQRGRVVGHALLPAGDADTRDGVD